MVDGAPPNGLILVLEQSRGAVERYLRAHGAGDAVDDLMQELALRLSQHDGGPVGAPLSYIYRVATNLMIDHRRSATQARRRDHDWAETFDRTALAADDSAMPDRLLDGRGKLQRLQLVLDKLPDRCRKILLMHRVDAIPQREIARNLGVSVSTVESDLRLAYAVIADLRRVWEKAEEQ